MLFQGNKTVETKKFTADDAVMRDVVIWWPPMTKAKKNDNSGIRTHALDGPAPEAGALDHSATLSLLMIYGTQGA